MINSADKPGSGLKTTIRKFDLVYFTQIKRIASNLSQEELSFLMGKSRDFVKHREQFKMKKEFYTNDFSTLARIFDCSAVDFFRPETEEFDTIKLLARQNKMLDKINYEVFRLRQDNSIELVYKISEIDPSKKYGRERKKELLTIAKKEVQALIEEGFFNEGPKRPIDIFYQCRNRCGFNIKAEFIDQALNEHILDDKQSILRKYKDDEFGYVYECIKQF